MTGEDVKLQLAWCLVLVAVAFFWVPLAFFYLVKRRAPPAFGGVVRDVVESLKNAGDSP